VDAAPVISRGHNVAAFVPPVTEAALPYVLQIDDRRTIVITADADRAVAFANALESGLVALGKSHLAISGLARAERRLAAGEPDVLLAGAADAVVLLRRSLLKPAAFGAIVVAWPEQLDEEGAAALEALLAECDRDAQRIIVSGEPGSALDQLIERYAFKAMTFGFPPAASADGWTAPPPVGPGRYVVARASQFADIRRRVLDALAPETDESVVISTCPESRAAAAVLSEAAPPGHPPVLVVEPQQLSWLRSLFSPLSPISIPTALDALERRAEALRDRVARTIETEDLDRELFLIGPLLERFDPSVVAAAALRLAGDPAQPARPARPATAGRADSGWADAGAGGEAGGTPSWSKIWVGIGKKDNVRPGDLVGAMTNQAKVPADAIGKIDVRDLFCLVEIKAAYAAKAAADLTGVTVKGRRLIARIDRGPGAPRPPRRA
jgi:hypothetical protein